MHILYRIIDFLQNSISKIDTMMINVSPIDKIPFVNLMPIPSVHSESANIIYSNKNKKRILLPIVLFDLQLKYWKKSHIIFIMQIYCQNITHKNSYNQKPQNSIRNLTYSITAVIKLSQICQKSPVLTSCLM